MAALLEDKGSGGINKVVIFRKWRFGFKSQLARGFVRWASTIG